MEQRLEAAALLAKGEELEVSSTPAGDFNIRFMF